jgi:hypothetical protein
MLYKYLSVNSKSYESILLRNEVYFAAVTNLNDPFEGLPKYDFPSKTKIKRHLIRRGAKHRNLKYLIPRAMQDLRINQKNEINIQKKLASSTGVLCLTPHRDSLLMWSHYASSHTGICIGFDINLPFDPIFGHGYEVIYQDEYPNICVLEQDLILAAALKNETVNSVGEDHMTKMFYTKSTCWEYEDEMRYIRPSARFGVGLMEFPRHKVKEVILGSNMLIAEESRILSIIENSYSNIRTYKAIVSSGEYKLQFSRIRSGETEC